jgi:hypothetical protein
LRILRYAAGLANTVIPGCPFNGDVNCDGATTSVDALKVLRYASGLTDAVMPGCLEIGK